MKEKGFWVSLDGVDAVGKTAQIPLVAALLNERLGKPVTTITEFSNTRVGDLIRDIVKSERFFRLSKDNLTPFSETLYLFTDRLVNVEAIVIPALSEGKIVLSDRGLLSPIGYQSQILKDSPYVKSQEAALQWLERLARLFPIRPNLNIVLSCSIDEINKRIKGRGEVSLDEQERDFLIAVDKAIMEASKLGGLGKTSIVDANQEIEKVTNIITDLILNIIYEEQQK